MRTNSTGYSWASIIDQDFVGRTGSERGHNQAWRVLHCTQVPARRWREKDRTVSRVHHSWHHHTQSQRPRNQKLPQHPNNPFPVGHPLWAHPRPNAPATNNVTRGGCCQAPLAGRCRDARNQCKVAGEGPRQARVTVTKTGPAADTAPAPTSGPRPRGNASSRSGLRHLRDHTELLQEA
jgi:hypothetical protein